MIEKIKFGLIGALLIIMSLIMVNAYWTGTNTGKTTSMTCSSDGKIVYLSDATNVYKSEDFGKNWVVITPKE